VYWFRPTARERRIGAMRQRAFLRGLQVELVRLPDAEPSPTARVTAGGVVRDVHLECVAYRLPDAEALRSRDAALLRAPSWRVRRTRLDAAGPVPGWRWDTPAPDTDARWRGHTRYWVRVRSLVDRLPDDAEALEAGPLTVSCCWRERMGPAGPDATVDALADLLSELIDLQREVRVKQRLSRD
jgi:hypothetical protein